MAGQSPLHTEMAQLNIDNKTTTRSTPPSVETAEQRTIRELQARLQQSEARVHQYENPFQYAVPTQDEKDYKYCVDRISRIHSEVNLLIDMGDRLGGMVVDPVYDVNRNHTDKGASKFDGITRNHVYEIRQSLDNLKLKVLPTLQNDLINTAKARYQREAINHKVNIVSGRRSMENQIRQRHQRDLAIARGRLLPLLRFPSLFRLRRHRLRRRVVRARASIILLLRPLSHSVAWFKALWVAKNPPTRYRWAAQEKI